MSNTNSTINRGCRMNSSKRLKSIQECSMFNDLTLNEELIDFCSVSVCQPITEFIFHSRYNH